MRTSRSLWKLVLTVACVLAAGETRGQELKVTLLGTGYPAPRMDRFGPSLLIEAGNDTLLIDCGRGAAQRLLQSNVPFPQVKEVFLTHLHSDHVVGIPDVWLSGWIRGRKAPLRLWGPRGTRAMAEHLQKAFEFDIHMRRDRDEMYTGEGWRLIGTDVREGVVYQQGEMKVTAFLVDHPPIVPSFGYRVDYRGRSVVVSGDTRPSSNLVKHATGVDVLVHEVIDAEAFEAAAPHLTREQRAKVVAHHTTADQAGELFSKAKPKLAVFTHVIPADGRDFVAKTRKKYAGPLEVGEDLMTIRVGEKITVERWTPPAEKR